VAKGPVSEGKGLLSPATISYA